MIRESPAGEVAVRRRVPRFVLLANATYARRPLNSPAAADTEYDLTL
jgi:hypothetical protein